MEEYIINSKGWVISFNTMDWPQRGQGRQTQGTRGSLEFEEHVKPTLSATLRGNMQGLTKPGINCVTIIQYAKEPKKVTQGTPQTTFQKVLKYHQWNHTL